MALGFGFNKAKVLSSAEKFVQQGKLPNAIAEYEKVAKQDPKDLTVLNTIGDLYSRLGRADQAAENFRKVGEAYAADGFVVKAIAMYKKLTKLNPSASESILRLAELYTQQGLYNDARAHYTSVADQYLKSNEREKATGILKKMLDLDPENAAMQAKVADLYLKLGKNKEALEIYFNSAQSLFQRNSMDAAAAALAHVLKLDANYGPALLLRGQIAAESGDNQGAIENLSRLPDLDSHPEALRPLLQAYVKTGNLEKADPITEKLIGTHKDLAAVTLYADALFGAGKPEQAMNVYEKHSDKFFPAHSQTLTDALTASVSKARESAPALQAMLTLLQRAGATGHVPREVEELLAHACVQAGELQKAADLYRALATAEPENPLHDQNYRQIIARMGKDSATRELSVEEGGQALMVDELEAAPAVIQEYSRDIAEDLNSALTDSELFSSYNVPEKAIPPLERVLPKAPNDVRVRQRLASLYARVNRFADAANCCTVLADVHAIAALTDQALQFREMAARYNEQAAEIAATAPAIQPVIDEPLPRTKELAVSEEPTTFQASSVAEFTIEAAAEQPSVAEFDLSSVPAEPLMEASATVPAETDSDHGGQWEDMLTVETPSAGPSETESAGEFDGGAVQEITADETPDEILEEARFYLSQGMASEAHSAIARLERVAPGHPELEELRSSAAASQPTGSAEAAVISDEPLAAEGTAAEVDLRPSTDIPAEPEPAAVEATRQREATLESSVQEEAVAEAAVQKDDLLKDVAVEPDAAEAPLEDLLPEVPAAASSRHVPPPPAMENPLAGLVSDLEDVLSDIAPAPSSRPVPAMRPAASGPPQVSARSGTSQAVQVSAQSDQGEAQSMLSDLLDEFKEGIEEPAEAEDDPDTHYNLGVAFREMGLLDEAIGELQKVCRALDNGSTFSQPIQAYTWLAQCLVDKGAAQAAIRWYERALRVNGISEDSRLAVYYDMANAFESAGNTKAALDNFMEVYGANIDYRDVAERIRNLRK